MDLHTENGLSAEVDRILDDTRRQLAEEFRRCVGDAIREAESAARSLAETQQEQALSSCREAVSAELREQFEQTLRRTVSALEADFKEKMEAAREEWDEERDRLRDQTNLWQTYANAQREMSESRSQGEILTHFLENAEAFAPNVAVYVSKADGLAIWKTRGAGPFPTVVSPETSDPENYFKAINVRDKTVAAIYARLPFSSEPLNFLANSLERAIETFGSRLQHRAVKAASS